MRIGIVKERRGLPRLLGLLVAGATLLGGMVILPSTQAFANDTDGMDDSDNFKAGALDTSIVPQLTVTKYLSLGEGDAAHGSAKDKPTSSNNKPGKGIVFNVHTVTAVKDKTLADIDPTNPSTYQVADNDGYYAGITDGNGVINKWFKAGNDGKPTSTEKTFPKGQNYYILSENVDASDAFKNGTLNASRYKTTANSFFGLPYKTTSIKGNTSGYIYNLHLYPKNIDTSSLTKTVTAAKDSASKDVKIVKAGDKVSYRIDQKIYNEGTAAVTGDQKLDVKEVVGDSKDLRIVDRMGDSLTLDTSSVKVFLTWGEDGKKELTSSDYTLTSEKKAQPPQRLVGTDKYFFDGEKSSATYHQFDFFKSKANLTSYLSGVTATALTVEITYTATVTAVGDSSDNGGVINKVQSDFRDNLKGGNPGDLPKDEAIVPSGTINFGKVKKAKGAATYSALKGAVFRLASPDDSAKYLASDGNFYADGDTLPSGVSIYTATSSETGLVTFTGLPIMSSDKGVEGNWNVVEYRAPSGYNTPSIAFSKIVFDSRVKGQTAESIITSFGSTPIEPAYGQLSFGRFQLSGTTPVTARGKAVDNTLVNYEDTDSDTPLMLPLTGGRGIVLLLVLGLAIMGGILYVRSRRKTTRA